MRESSRGDPEEEGASCVLCRVGVSRCARGAVSRVLLVDCLSTVHMTPALVSTVAFLSFFASPTHFSASKSPAIISDGAQPLYMKFAERKPSKPRKKKPKKKPPASTPVAASPRSRPASVQPEKPTEQEDQARYAHMATVNDAILRAAPALLEGLSTQGFAVVDDFLPLATVLEMRAECESLRTSGRMETSQSTRWDEEAGELVSYNKHNVLSTNLAGGAEYHLSPRLVEYCVSMVSTLPPLVNDRFPEVKLSDKLHTNKLAVCLGDGSKYDKHYDNQGGDDLRKLTCLIYLQESWEESHGGYFRMFANGSEKYKARAGLRVGRSTDVGEELWLADETEDGFPTVDIAPLGGRLLAFWSDRMVHGVLPSFAVSESSYRWALTVWMQTDEPSAIAIDPEMESKHFVQFPSGGQG